MYDVYRNHFGTEGLRVTAKKREKVIYNREMVSLCKAFKRRSS